MLLYGYLACIYLCLVPIRGFSARLNRFAEKGRNISEFVDGRQCGRSASEITIQDAERQGWRFTNRSLPTTPLLALAVDERIDLWEINAVYDKANEFHAYMNFAQGKILAYNSKRKNKDLYNWSTIIMIAYKTLSLRLGGSISSLNLVIRCNVDNIHTGLLIEELLEDHPDILPLSTKTSLSHGGQPYYSMIGSPNGLGVAYMLFEHRADIGFKVFDDVSVSAGAFSSFIWFSFKDNPASVRPSALSSRATTLKVASPSM